MKTQLVLIRCYKITVARFQNGLSLLLILISLNCFSQTVANKSEPVISNKEHLTTLQNVVDGIKEKNKSIKNVEHVNVMVNDMLIENLQDFNIDPKSISMVEVLVLEPKAGTGERINPSIIIDTKKIR